MHVSGRCCLPCFVVSCGRGLLEGQLLWHQTRDRKQKRIVEARGEFEARVNKRTEGCIEGKGGRRGGRGGGRRGVRGRGNEERRDNGARWNRRGAGRARGCKEALGEG
eukprot:753261-Hanusia_phi.AAC.3